MDDLDLFLQAAEMLVVPARLPPPDFAQQEVLSGRLFDAVDLVQDLSFCETKTPQHSLVIGLAQIAGPGVGQEHVPRDGKVNAGPGRGDVHRREAAGGKSAQFGQRFLVSP